MSQRSDESPAAILDVMDTARYLGKTESATRHMIERGRIPALKLGGRVYCRRETLDRYLEKLEREFTKARGGE